MKFRGQRECQDCGTRWSYYETGEVACPNCESLRSRGIDEPTEHTDAPVSIDLSQSRSMVESGDLSEALDDATERCREFVTRTGFIHEGAFQPLSDTYLAANELIYAARESLRSMRIDEEEELYLLTLLQGVDTDQRPSPEEVPRSMRTARGLAAADAIGDYQNDLRTYLDGDSKVRRELATITEHVRRIEALDGDIDLMTTERIVHATQDIGEYVRTGDEERLATARDRLDDIE